MSVGTEKKKLIDAVDNVSDNMKNVVDHKDTPVEVREELQEDLKFLNYLREKATSSYNWGRRKLRNLGRRLRDFLHACLAWVKRAVKALVSAVVRAVRWLLQAVETAIEACIDVADRFLRIIFPSQEDVARAQLEEINEAAVEAVSKTA